MPPLEVKKNSVKEHHAENDEEGEDNLSSFVKPKKTKPLKKKKKKKDDKVEETYEDIAIGGESSCWGSKWQEEVFDLPGQKRDPPEQRDPLRIFYETLYQQLPHSQLAAIWMMEYGLLPREVAETVHEKKQMKKNQLKLSSPTKVVATVKKTTKSVTVDKTKFSPDSTAKKTTKSVTVKKTLGCSSASKTELKQSKKRRMGNSVSEDIYMNQTMILS